METEQTVTDLCRGDKLPVVITDTNDDSSKDPVTEIDGMTTFIRFENGYQPSFGEMVTVKIADIADSHIVAVATDDTQ